MTADSGQNAKPSLGRRRLLLACVIAAGGLAAIAIELSTASHADLINGIFPWTFMVAVLVNVIALLGRWLLTKNRGKIYLLGRLPFSIALAKIAILVATVFLILFLLFGLIVGEPYRTVALSALVSGMVWSGLLFLLTNGLLNAIVVARHLRGTLSATSRPS